MTNSFVRWQAQRSGHKQWRYAWVRAADGLLYLPPNEPLEVDFLVCDLFHEFVLIGPGDRVSLVAASGD